jgi:hypothetical protein
VRSQEIKNFALEVILTIDVRNSEWCDMVIQFVEELSKSGNFPFDL